MTRKRAFVAGAAVGAAVECFLDPRCGRRRRHVACARCAAAGRRSLRRARTRAQLAAGRAHGVVHRLRPAPRHVLDDVELAHKVESVLGRDRAIPKGRFNVNAEHGTVYLRGTLDDERLIERIAIAAWTVPEVDQVVNLLRPLRGSTDLPPDGNGDLRLD